MLGLATVALLIKIEPYRMERFTVSSISVRPMSAG
jgi:hypothetical protein